MTERSRVQKFRSVQDMNRAPVTRPAPGDIEQFFRHCARYRVLAKRVYPRGVFKFRSIDEAERERP